jgi:hypothetical protein
LTGSEVFALKGNAVCLSQAGKHYAILSILAGSSGMPVRAER